MAWKKILVGSDQTTPGAVLPEDLTTVGGAQNSGYYLGVEGNGTGISWQLDQSYDHPNYTTADININSGVLTGATVISDFEIAMVTNDIGSVTSTTSTINTRDLTLADLSYVGDFDANNYEHPTHPGDDISLSTGTLDLATVIESLDITFETDAKGHVLDASASHTTRDLTRGDLGYTGAFDADKYQHWTMQIVSQSGSTLENENISSTNQIVLRAGQNCDWVTTYSSGILTATLNATADYVGHITEVNPGWGMDFTAGDSNNPAMTVSMGTVSWR